MNLWKKIKWFFVSGAPSIKKPETISLKELQSRTKKQLESIGRKMGIELDRRLTKSKLINKIKFRARMKSKKR
ncbi:MAG: hypothetical protein CMO44_13555 [Verrucomicrobiales bacterium]|nr:hypothetical protein [Verrucomicrobiales bacterium]|tara:strand:+ start:424 stop:642 length:219 start_codon:yes stop_codon:yes gene_type:complete